MSRNVRTVKYSGLYRANKGWGEIDPHARACVIFNPHGPLHV